MLQKAQVPQKPSMCIFFEFQVLRPEKPLSAFIWSFKKSQESPHMHTVNGAYQALAELIQPLVKVTRQSGLSTGAFKNGLFQALAIQALLFQGLQVHAVSLRFPYYFVDLSTCAGAPMPCRAPNLQKAVTRHAGSQPANRPEPNTAYEPNSTNSQSPTLQYS